jgi:hypothetical protein
MTNLCYDDDTHTGCDAAREGRVRELESIAIPIVAVSSSLVSPSLLFHHNLLPFSSTLSSILICVLSLYFPKSKHHYYINHHSIVL